MISVFYAIVGCTMLGVHFGSPWVGIGMYCCIVAIGNWDKS